MTRLSALKLTDEVGVRQGLQRPVAPIKCFLRRTLCRGRMQGLAENLFAASGANCFCLAAGSRPGPK